MEERKVSVYNRKLPPGAPAGEALETVLVNRGGQPGTAAAAFAVKQDGFGRAFQYPDQFGQLLRAGFLAG